MFSERHPLGKSRDDDQAGFSALELAKVHLLSALDLIRESQAAQTGPPSDLFAQVLSASLATVDLLVALLSIAAREHYGGKKPTKK